MGSLRFCFFLFVSNILQCHSNQVPIIGILTIPTNQQGNWVSVAPGYIVNYTTSFIVSDYVQWLRSGGAKWIPIVYTDSWENISALLLQINGIFFQGGAGEYDSQLLYYKRFNQILDFLRTFAYHNQNRNKSIPLWATCLGFEGLIAATSINGKKSLSDFNAQELMSSIDYIEYNLNNSMIFNSNYISNIYSKLVIEYTSNYNITFNDHMYGVLPHTFNSDPYLSGNFSNLGVSYDRNNIPFVTLIESKTLKNSNNNIQLSWYASQFHPEKASYQFTSWYWPSDKLHTIKSVIVNDYFAQFFVNQCRLRNKNKMNYKLYQKYIKTNYQNTFIGKNAHHTDVSIAYESVYWFPQST